MNRFKRFTKDYKEIPEGKITTGSIKGLDLFIKKKVISYSKRVKSEEDTNKD